MEEFLNRDDTAKSIDLERLRQQYLQDTKTNVEKMPKLDSDNLERYISKQRSK